jgi:gliding motility-associated-like protein
MRHLLSAAFLLITSTFAFSQMTISTGVLTPAQYVNNLVGPGITISNVTYTGTTQQVGSFGGTSNIGFGSGVVLSSGATTELVGPATSATAGQNNVSGISNADLLSVANTAATAVGSGTISSTTDAAILEFDFVPISNVVSFNFVFSSDEYLTYVNSVFNDVFGFFVSGPGITGPYAAPAGFPNGSQNLALVPNSTLPITISTIHPGLNPQYYVSNAGGTTHVMNGFTTPIPITFDVQCGETYHFKFAVADCQDNYLSTAVFLQDDSFTSPPVNVSLQTANGTDTIPEACVDADFLFIRSACTSNDTLVVNYTVSGTATDDVDYILQDSPVTLLPGQDTATINIAPIVDALIEGVESIVITVNYVDAGGNAQTISGTVYIADIEPVVITETDLLLKCFNDSIPISVAVTGGSGVYSYDWLSSSSTAANDTVAISQNGTYNYLITVTDLCLGPKTDTVTIVMNQTLIVDTMWMGPATCEPIGWVSGFILGQTGVPQYNWSGPGANSPNNIDASVWENLSSGWYYFNVEDNVCAVDDSIFVTILNPPIAAISPSTYSGCTPEDVIFTNNSQNASNFAWDFGNGQTANLTTTASQSQTFTSQSLVQLIASEGVCADTAYVLITINICGCTDPTATNYDPTATVDDGTCYYPIPTVIAPNVFSPNGDEDNELFYLTTTNATSITLTILNRWGNVVFESTGINPAWNGKIQNGSDAGDGVYFYKYIVNGLQDVVLEGHGFLHLVR